MDGTVWRFWCSPFTQSNIRTQSFGYLTNIMKVFSKYCLNRLK